MSSAGAGLGPGDYAFLGMVALGCDTAYDIKKAMAGSISFFWSAAHSQVYQHASRLVRDGYVREREEKAGRRRKILSLTPKGKRALTAWLTEPADALQLRDEMLVKVFFGALADPEGTRAMLEDQRELYRNVLDEFDTIENTLRHASGTHARYQHMTVRLGQRTMRAYLEWLDETIAAL